MRLKEKISKCCDNIFFKQKRIGKHGVIFTVYKIRTMVYNAEKNIPDGLLKGQDKEENDSRIIASRKFLRKYGIDEVPQIINIIKGEMSLFGPRPVSLDRFKIYTDYQKKIRHNVTPGVFGNYGLYNKNKKTNKKRTLIELEDIYLKIRAKKENKGFLSITLFNSWIFVNAISAIIKGANK